MKKLIIVIFTIPLIALGQSKVNGYVELTQKFPFSSLCFDSNISLGLSLLLKYGTLIPIVSYEYGGNVKDNSHVPYRNVPAYRLSYHLMGGE